MEAPKPVRSFLAIEVSPEVRQRIGKIQERLGMSLKSIRWTRPEGIHLTLKFFGDIYERDLAAIGGAVEGRAAAEAPVSLRAGGLGAFPNPDRARVLWIGLDGDLERLSRLQRDLDGAFERLGYPREKRSFKPHLTLGRARGERILGVQDVLRRGESHQAGSFEAGALILFRSELKPGGAVYTKMAEFPFLGSGGGTPAGAEKG